MVLVDEVRDFVVINNRQFIVDTGYDVIDGVWFAIDGITKIFVLGKNKDEAQKRLKALVRVYYESA